MGTIWSVPISVSANAYIIWLLKRGSRSKAGMRCFVWTLGELIMGSEKYPHLHRSSDASYTRSAELTVIVTALLHYRDPCKRNEFQMPDQTALTPVELMCCNVFKAVETQAPLWYLFFIVINVRSASSHKQDTVDRVWSSLTQEPRCSSGSTQQSTKA